MAAPRAEGSQAALNRPPAAASTDSFAGKRSLATTRMFLFDLCERMFARRDPALAEAFREALRQAKDREAMLLPPETVRSWKPLAASSPTGAAAATFLPDASWLRATHESTRRCLHG